MTDPTQYLLVPACAHARHSYTLLRPSQATSPMNVGPASLAGMFDELVLRAAPQSSATLGEAVRRLVAQLAPSFTSDYAFHAVTQTTWTKPHGLVPCAGVAHLEYRDEPVPTCTILAAAAMVADTRFTLDMGGPSSRGRPSARPGSGRYVLIRPARSGNRATGIKGNASTGSPKVQLYRGGPLSGLGLSESYLERGQPGPPPVFAFAAGDHPTVELACVYGRFLGQGLDFYQIGPGGKSCLWQPRLSRGQVSQVPDGIIAVPPSLTHRLRH